LEKWERSWRDQRRGREKGNERERRMMISFHAFVPSSLFGRDEMK